MRFVCSQCRELMEVVSVGEEITYVDGRDSEHIVTGRRVVCGNCGNVIFALEEQEVTDESS